MLLDALRSQAAAGAVLAGIDGGAALLAQEVDAEAGDAGQVEALTATQVARLTTSAILGLSPAKLALLGTEELGAISAAA